MAWQADRGGVYAHVPRSQSVLALPTVGPVDPYLRVYAFTSPLARDAYVLVPGSRTVSGADAGVGELTTRGRVRSHGSGQPCLSGRGRARAATAPTRRRARRSRAVPVAPPRPAGTTVVGSRPAAPRRRRCRGQGRGSRDARAARHRRAPPARPGRLRAAVGRADAGRRRFRRADPGRGDAALPLRPGRAGAAAAAAWPGRSPCGSPATGSRRSPCSPSVAAVLAAAGRVPAVSGRVGAAGARAQRRRDARPAGRPRARPRRRLVRAVPGAERGADRGGGGAVHHGRGERRDRRGRRRGRRGARARPDGDGVALARGTARPGEPADGGGPVRADGGGDRGADAARAARRRAGGGPAEHGRRDRSRRGRDRGGAGGDVRGRAGLRRHAAGARHARAAAARAPSGARAAPARRRCLLAVVLPVAALGCSPSTWSCPSCSGPPTSTPPRRSHRRWRPSSSPR